MITTAATVVEKLVGYYEKFPEKAADLQAAQVALKLIRPGNTRWNSFVDSWIRAVELKPLIIQQGQIEITPQQWQAMEQAIVLSDPFAAATDVMQSDSSNLLTLSQVFESMVWHISSRGDEHCA